MADLETLQIRIKADADGAYKAIDKLAISLNNLGISIGRIETGKLNDLASGLDNLSYALKTARQAVKTSDYTAIFKNFTTLSNIDTARLDTLAGSLNNLASGFTNMTAANSAAIYVKDMAAAIAKLGGVKVEAAVTNIPRLEKALAHLLKTFAQIPNINQSIIDFVNSLSNLASQGSHVGPATKSIEHSLESFGSSATRATRKAHSLASVIGTLYAKFWLFMRGARGLKNSFVSAADYLEAFNYFDVTARKIGKDTFSKAGVGSAEQYAEAFTKTLQEKLHKMSGLELDVEQRLIKTTNAKSLGLNLTELTQYQATIASLTNSMGVTQEVAEASSKALSMLAGDIASLRNMDFTEVSSKLQSGLTGMARSLYSFGIDITNATLEEYAYAEGISKSVSEMTQSEKAQLRLLAILDQSKVAWGDLANTINSPNNQLRMLQTNLKETGTVFGQLFIPIMESALPVINGLALAIKQLLVDIAELLGIKLNLDSFGQFGEDIEADIESMDDLNKAVKETKKTIRDFDELKVINDSKNKGTGVGDQIDLTKQIVDATNEYEKVWDEAYKRMTSKASEIAGYISGAFEPIKEIIKDFHIGDFFKAGEDVSKLVISIFDYVSKAINDVDWETLGQKVGDFLKGLDWAGILKGIGGILASGIQAAIDIWQGLFDAAPFETAILASLAILKFTGVGASLTTSLGGAISGWFKNHGIDKSFLAKAGIGAIAVGLSLKFTIDAITDVQAGEYQVKSLAFFSKAAISSLLAGAGFTLLGSSLGLVAGGSGMLLTFGIAAGLSMVFNIIAAELSKPEPNIEREIAEQEYAWVQDKHLDNIEFTANLTMKEGNLTAQMGNIDFLAGKVEELSSKYNELTDAEREQLKYYSDELVKVVPEVANQIDKVTGAYKGTREELEKLIATQKAQIQQAALTQITADIQRKQYELQPEYERLKSEQSRNWDRFQTASDQLRERGLTEAQLLELIQGKSVDGVSDKIAKEYKQIYENLQASNNAFSVIESDWNALAEKYEYYMGEYEKAVETTLGNTSKDLNDANDENAKIIKSTKLPKAMSSTLGRIDTVIKRDGKISETDMNSLFNSINSSFAGLEDGNIPKEIQDTMNKVKLAIIQNSPEIVGLLAELRSQMENALSGVLLTKDGNILWNLNGISERLDADVNNIEEALHQNAKPGTKTLETDLLELFGVESADKLPKSVNKALKGVADTINNGEGKNAILSALDTLKYETSKEAEKLGMYLDWGTAGGIYNGKPAVKAATSDMVHDGFENTYMKESESRSPSRLARRLAKYLPEGAALGIEDGIPTFESAVKNMVGVVSSMFGNVRYNVPDLGIGSVNSRSGFNYGSMDSNNGFVSQMLNMANTAAQSGQTEVVFRVEGDPYGMFKIIREENDKYKRQHSNRSAFN